MPCTSLVGAALDPPSTASPFCVHACSAVLVDAIQKIGMRYRPQRQLWATAVLLATRGLELTLMKSYLDDGGDYHTCYKLVYHDLQVGSGEGGERCWVGCLWVAGRAGGRGDG